VPAREQGLRHWDAPKRPFMNKIVSTTGAVGGIGFANRKMAIQQQEQP